MRKLTEEERKWLERISRSQSEPASHVIRAKEILAVADGCSYTQAAERAGRKCGDPVSHLKVSVYGHPRTITASASRAIQPQGRTTNGD